MDIENKLQSAFVNEAVSHNKFEDYLEKPYFYTYSLVKPDCRTICPQERNRYLYGVIFS